MRVLIGETVLAKMLNQRRASLLSFIIQDYVDTAVPVGSQVLVRRHRIPYSSATVRLEMARLEDEGYITQPHTSAGRVPSDKGYRYYIEALMSEEALDPQSRETIRHQFHQAERALEDWFQLAAAVLARSVSNFAVVTAPRSKETRLRHLQLVALQDFTALCIVVLQEARLRQQVIALKEAMDQDELSVLANRLNVRFGGMSLTDIVSLPEPISEVEERVLESVVDMMTQESMALGEVFRDGVREVLSQPEFARSDRILDLVDVLEERSLAASIPVRSLLDEGVSVVIGSENSIESMRDCSIVVSRYGEARGSSGVVAVLGPTRMRYNRIIPTVRFLAAVLGDLVSQI